MICLEVECRRDLLLGSIKMQSTLTVATNLPVQLAAPLITIGVTTYDRRELLRQCVSSILAQSYSNIEVIIGNDFVAEPVTYGSLGIAPDSRVKIVNHQKNIGAYANNHYLLRVASGDWFTWLADDDLMHPEFLSNAHHVLTKYAVNSVFTNYVAMPNPDGVFPKAQEWVEPKIFSGTQFLEEYTHRRIKTVGSYGVYRRELFNEISAVPRFGSGLPVYGDTFIPILAASLGRVAYIDLDLIFLRTHPGSRSVSENLIATYSAAQMDFLFEFERRCKSLLLRTDYERQVESLLRWFVADGWGIVCRKHSRAHARLSNFYRYFITTIIPAVPKAFKASFSLFVIRLVLGDTARYLVSRAFRRTKAWV